MVQGDLRHLLIIPNLKIKNAETKEHGNFINWGKWDWKEI